MVKSAEFSNHSKMKLPFWSQQGQHL